MSDAAAGKAHDVASNQVTRWMLPLVVTLGTALLAAGYWKDAPDVWATAVTLVPALLWVAARRRWALAVDVSFAAFVVLAGLGVLLRVRVGWMLPALVCGLAAWDLARFQQRLVLAGHVERRAALEVRHVAHVLPVLVAGLVLALVGAYVRLNLGFLPNLLLGALAVAGLAATVLYLRRGDGI